MNLTIEELERRFWIEGKLKARAALLAFEAAWDEAEDSWLAQDVDTESLMPVEAISGARICGWRPEL